MLKTDAAAPGTAEIEPSSSIAEFQQLLAEKSGVQPHEQELLSGFPPRPLQLPGDRAGTAVASLGIQSGDSLTVTRAANPLPQPPAPAAAAAAAVDLNHFNVEGMVRLVWLCCTTVLQTL